MGSSIPCSRASLRKGIHYLACAKGDPLFGGYLAEAFQRIDHPAKTLSFVGWQSAEMITLLRQQNLWPEDARVLGHVSQSQLKDVMSRSHVMVLPSVEEGLALVQAQAMASGCPMIETYNTGAEDLFSDGQEGYIVPIRDAGALAGTIATYRRSSRAKGRDGAKSPGQRKKPRRLASSTVRKPCRFSTQFPTPWTVPDARL
jgi:glycosyltransferase involved in cell wall biosynthesis